jgi:hypothetical protein
MAPSTYQGVIPKLVNNSGANDVTATSLGTVDNAIVVFDDGFVAVPLARSSFLSSFLTPNTDALFIFRWLRRRALTAKLKKEIDGQPAEMTASDFAAAQGGRFIPWSAIRKINYTAPVLRGGSTIAVNLLDNSNLGWTGLDRSVNVDVIRSLLAPHLGDRLVGF